MRASHLENKEIAAPSGAKVLLVDLNAFASFPTLAIGLLTATLRREGHTVDVICPLDHGRPTVLRERRERLIDHIMRRIHLSGLPPALPLRDVCAALGPLGATNPTT